MNAPSISNQNDEPNPTHIAALVDLNLLNNPSRLRERADALDAADQGRPVDRWNDGEWIPLEDITAFFFDRRYRARPVAP